MKLLGRGAPRRLVDRLTYANVVAALMVVVVSSAFASSASFAEELQPVRNGAPPVVVCGQTLYSGAVGPVTDDFTQPGRYALSGGLEAQVALPKILDFVTSCQTGVSVAIEPRRDIKIYSEARTEDHKIAALALVARRAGLARVIVTRPEGRKTIIVIRVYPAERYDHGNKVET